MPSIFTFNRDLVNRWLYDAKLACARVCLYNPDKTPIPVPGEPDYGGPAFSFEDTSTHWTEAGQLYTWWKNNVERRHKFRLLQEDTQYTGCDSRRRARYIASVVCLAV